MSHIEGHVGSGQGSQAAYLLDQVQGMDINCALHTFTYDKTSLHCGMTLVEHAQFLSILTGRPTLMPNLSEVIIGMDKEQVRCDTVKKTNRSMYSGVKTEGQIHLGVVEFAYTASRLCHSLDHTVTVGGHDSSANGSKNWPMSTKIVHNPSTCPRSLVTSGTGSGIHASIQTQLVFFHNKTASIHDCDISFIGSTLIPLIQQFTKMSSAGDTLAHSFSVTNLPRAYSRSLPQKIEDLGLDKAGLDWSTMSQELKDIFDPQNRLGHILKMEKQRARRGQIDPSTGGN